MNEKRCQQIVCLKRGGVAVPSDKADFKTKVITRGKKGHFLMKNWPIHEKDIIIINMYASDNRASQTHEAKQVKLKREMDSL